MEITLTVNGKQVKATVDDQEMKEAMGEKKKKTGYEYAQSGYFYVDSEGVVKYAGGPIEGIAFREYTAGNHYRDSNVAKNNARADMLMRKLRRFAAEHGGCVAGRRKTLGAGYIIEMPGLELCVREVCAYGMLGCVAFSTYEAAERAIEIFRDDLLWYFNEYDPMPEGWWDS